jgi:hypothetical protein
MKLARKIDRGVLVVAALALALALPALARANPLLSGYGGPGQGSQALLGSSLTGGHGRGGVASEGTPPEQALEAHSTSTAAPSTAGASETQTASKAGHSAAAAPGTGGGPGSGSGPTGGQTLPSPALAPKSSVHTDAAGLSSGDLALIVVAIAVILATGMLMARLRNSKPHNGGT